MTCRRCGRDRPESEFSEYKPGYRRRVCQRCINERRAERRKSDPESADRKRGRRRDAAAERVRLGAYGKSAAGRAARRRRRQRRREHVNAQNRSYRARDRAATRQRARRHMRLRRLGYDRDLIAWTDVLTADPCAYCGGDATGVDHITAVARGGLNTAENLIGACIGCNRQKRTTPLLEFLARR